MKSRSHFGCGLKVGAADRHTGTDSVRPAGGGGRGEGPRGAPSERPAIGLVIKYVRFNYLCCSAAAGHLVWSWPPSIELLIPRSSPAAPAMPINLVDRLQLKWENVGFRSVLRVAFLSIPWRTEEWREGRGKKDAVENTSRLKMWFPVENCMLSLWNI